MEKAVIKLDMGQVVSLIKKWAQDHNMPVAEARSIKTNTQGGFKECAEIESKSRHYTVVWPEVNKDVQSLKQALVKISTAQIPYFLLSGNSVGHEKKLPVKIVTKLKVVFVSIDVFFGDRLFGYARSYLSERLKAVEE